MSDLTAVSVTPIIANPLTTNVIVNTEPKNIIVGLVDTPDNTGLIDVSVTQVVANPTVTSVVVKPLISNIIVGRIDQTATTNQVDDFKLRALIGFYPNGEVKEFQNVDGNAERFEWWDRQIGTVGAIKLLTAELSYGIDDLVSQVIYTDWRRLANGSIGAKIRKTITWVGGLDVKMEVIN